MPRQVCFPDPVTDRANLYDRTAALAGVLNSLKHRTTVVRGGRLMGKTSLLNVVALSAEDQGEFAVIRLAPTDSRVAFMAEILDSIHQWVDEHGHDSLRIPGASRHRALVLNHRLHTSRQAVVPEQPVNTVAQFCQRIARLAEMATGVVFLLCLDEFDSFIQNWDEHEARLVLELIAHLDAMPKLPVRFFLTLSSIPDLLLSSFRSPILNQSKIITLEPWGASETAKFTKWLVDDQLIFDEAACAALFAAAGGHPYFTKAVLNTLLTDPPVTLKSRQVSVEHVTAAVWQVVRTPEVDLALTNLTGAHLTAEAIALLDRAGNSPAGLPARSVGELAAAGHLLADLQANGFLRTHGDRYLLRLGLWRDWRAATWSNRTRRPLLRRIGCAAKRVRSRRVTSGILLGAVAGPLLAVALSTFYLAPERTIFARPCGGSSARLAVYARYPAFASTGDRQQIRVILLNNGPVAVHVSALIRFPGDRAGLGSPNGITSTELRPGEEATLDVDFTTTVPAGWTLSGSHVPVELAVSAAGACRAQHWSISVAPIPRLQLIQKIAGSVLVVFLIPFLAPFMVEFVTKRLLREGRGARIEATATKAG